MFQHTTPRGNRHPMPQRPPLLPQRRQGRDAVNFRTTLLTDDHAPLDIRLTNISPTGFCGRINRRFEIGEKVRVLLPLAQQVEANIAWSLSGCFGAHFIYGFDAESYPYLLAALKSA